MMTDLQPEALALPGVIRYRVREPVVISAIEWTGGNEEDVRAFAGGHWDTTVSPCFVARGVTGHLFTVDADRFAATYEATIAPGVPASADTGRDLSAALVKAQARAGAAEAKLAEIAAYVHEHGGDAGL